MIGAIAGEIVDSRPVGGPAPHPGFTLFLVACRFTDDSVYSIAGPEA